MQYATVQDMIDRFGQAELVQLTDPQLLAVQAPKAQRALDDAQHLADAYVGQVYALPLAGCSKPAPVPGDVHAQSQVPPPLLTRLVCDVARYYLYDHLAPEHEVALRFDARPAGPGESSEAPSTNGSAPPGQDRASRPTTQR